MLLDALVRFSGKKLFGHGVFYVSRGIWWAYGMAVVWMLGGLEYRGYRKFLGYILGQLFSEVYDGYFGSKWFTFWIFHVRINNVKADPSELVENSCFIELIVIGLLRLLEIITFKSRRNGGALGNLFGTLRRCASVYLCMYMWQYSLRFYSFLHAVSDMGAEGELTFTVALSYACCVYIQLEMGYFLFEMFYATWNMLKSKSNEGNYTETQNPAVAQQNPIVLSYQAIIDEITFSYVRKEVAAKNKLVAFYNFHFYFRWAAYSLLVTIWYNNPRTIYSIFLAYSFFQYIYTIYIWIIGGFNRPAGFIIALSELCIFVRHIAGFALFVDYFGSRGFSENTDDFWEHIAFWAYITGLICEFTLVWEPFFRTGTIVSAPAPIKLLSKPAPIPIINDDELFNKV